MKKVEFDKPDSNVLGWFVSSVQDNPFLYLREDGAVEGYSTEKSVYFKTEQEAIDALNKYNGEYKMKKSDLKTGMIVEVSDGYHRMVLGNSLMGISGCSGGIHLSSVNDD